MGQQSKVISTVQGYLSFRARKSTLEQNVLKGIYANDVFVLYYRNSIGFEAKQT